MDRVSRNHRPYLPSCTEEQLNHQAALVASLHMLQASKGDSLRPWPGSGSPEGHTFSDAPLSTYIWWPLNSRVSSCPHLPHMGESRYGFQHGSGAIRLRETQLTLEQRGCELHRSMYIGIFFLTKGGSKIKYLRMQNSHIWRADFLCMWVLLGKLWHLSMCRSGYTGTNTTHIRRDNCIF